MVSLVLFFFAFLVEKDSSKGRFWAGIDAMSWRLDSDSELKKKRSNYYIILTHLT